MNDERSDIPEPLEPGGHLIPDPTRAVRRALDLAHAGAPYADLLAAIEALDQRERIVPTLRLTLTASWGHERGFEHYSGEGCPITLVKPNHRCTAHAPSAVGWDIGRADGSRFPWCTLIDHVQWFVRRDPRLDPKRGNRVQWAVLLQPYATGHPCLPFEVDGPAPYGYGTRPLWVVGRSLPGFEGKHECNFTYDEDVDHRGQHDVRRDFVFYPKS